MDLLVHRPVVLLAEADTIVAEDLGDALEQAGYRVLGPFATTAEALAAIEWENPSFAVLDVRLREGFCTALGHKLRQRSIPILVHSGLQQDDPRALAFREMPWFCKPALPKDIISALNELASQGSPMSAEKGERCA
ncbi:response regulator [Methylobacterium flocculans]|uniref:hypothetical protein n=1 Tax=Methylobacterium flocculans TaxID=2984843 RepID=UPI0021F32DCC|nr:hypothetical protein [Methylobacterium sp. FF17]